MADIEAVEVLTQAKERLFEHGWGKWTHETRESQGDSDSLCLEEALMGRRGAFCAYGPMPIRRASQYVRSVVGLGYESSLFVWNDTSAQSASDVFNAVDEATLVAKSVSVVPPAS